MPGRKDYTATDPIGQRVWDTVSGSPLGNLWDFQKVSPLLVFKKTLNSLMDDNLVSRAAELGFYFLFALFPTLVSASAILGLAAKKAPQIYERLLAYLTLVVPASAYDLVIKTFQQTTAASSGGKLTLGLVAALWSASVGFSAMQDGMNAVYKTRETRPYWKARGSAILVTVLLSVLVSLNLGVLLGGDILARKVWDHMQRHDLAMAIVVLLHIVQWIVASALLLVQFSTIYYYAPDLKAKCWQWLTPGAMLGLLGWVGASLGLKAYLHFFNSYSVTYGSLGAVIVLLTWFYISGLMLLVGAEINSEIQAAVVERQLRLNGELLRGAETTVPDL
ncbi:YihY/virulence factor BrkB family protein [Granulicella paludicola]|uniref:YihY/virulence factor BrkB family protein n=1 Tax=Granulicella paludicola TaxID=474951 RepID=UPI0021DF6D78|nr:YihY/virulence factor BrkB family protein [Granulicella paludicola]